MAAFSIIGDLILKTGSFETDTARADKSLQRLKKSGQDTAAAFKASFAGNLLAGFARDLTIALTRIPGDVLESIDAFNDLRDATGASIEKISALDRVARETGVGFATVETSLVKLNQALNAAKPDSETAFALQAIGLSAKELKGLDPADAVLKVAQALDKFATDGSKARVVQTLFGKSLKEVAPLLNDLAQKSELVGTTTEESAKRVEDFRKGSFKLKADIDDLARAFVVNLLPALTETTSKMKELFGITGKSAFTLRTEIIDLEREIRRLEALKTGKGFSLEKSFLGEEEINRRIEKQKKLLAQTNDLMAALSGAGAGRGSVNPPLIENESIGDVQTKEDLDKAAAAFKKALEARIKLAQDFGRAQADQFHIANQLLDGEYNQALISQEAFFDKQKKNRDGALKAQLAVIDQEIAAARELANSPLVKEEDRTEGEEKRKRLIQERADLVRKAAGEEKVALQSNKAATDQLADAYQSLNAQILQLSGDEVGAAFIRNAQQVRAATTLIKQAGGDPTELTGQLDALLKNQVKAAEIQKNYGKLLDDTARKEEEIYLNALAAGKGELEILNELGNARRVNIGLLREQARAAEELAAKGNSTDEDKKRAADLALAVKKAAAEIDPLAIRINTTLEDAFTSPFASFIAGTKSASEAFRDFGRSILAEAANIAAKNIAKQIFGQGGGQEGLGGLLSRLFSSFGGGGGTAGNDVGLAFANGGSPPVGRASLVGERGPELFVPRTSGTIIPNHQLGGRGPVVINNNYAAGNDVQTRERDDGTLEIFIEKAAAIAHGRVAADVGSGSGQVSRSMKARGVNLDRGLSRRA